MPSQPTSPSTPPPTQPSAGVRLARALALGSLLALIALGMAWELRLAPLRPGGSWLVLKVLPLCLPLVGLLKNRLYTYRWLSLLVWLYVTEALVRVSSDHGLSAWLAGVELGLSLLLFGACAAVVRLRLRAGRSATDPAPPHPTPMNPNEPMAPRHEPH